MPVRALIARILLVSTSVLLAPLCAAKGLIGIERNSFVRANYESCLTRWAANPASSSLPTDLGAKFCRCSANRHADKTSHTDLKRLNELMVRKPQAMVAKLRPVLKEVSDYCMVRVVPDPKK
jgi:hypothetical protein